MVRSVLLRTSFLGLIIITFMFFTTITSPANTTAQENDFPVVKNYRMLDYAFISSFRISNTGRYVAEFGAETARLREIENYQDLPIFYVSSWVGTWDGGSQQLALYFRGRSNCEFPNVETTLIIYSLIEDSASYRCLPFVYTDFDISWSPISQNTLLINNKWIFKMDTNEILPIGELFIDPYRLNEVVSSYLEDPASSYTALDRYIWDTSVDVPVFKVAYRETRDANTEEMIRQFVMCIPWSTAFDFTSCTNAISIPENTYVAYYDLSTQSPNMLLWIGIESSQEAPYLSVDLEQYEDTVIYMTDLVTRETQELFRLSDISEDNLFFDVFADWSPNGETLAMSIAAFAGEEPPRLVPDSKRTLIFTLDWGDIPR